jgi:alginate O-acetyltransferase complex protein AlgI
VFWGALHGVFLIIQRVFRDYSVHRPRLENFLRSVPGTALRMALTFTCVSAGWVFFRSATLETALTLLHRVAAWSPGLGTPMPRLSLTSTLMFMALCHAVVCWLPRRKLLRIPAPIQGFAYAAALVLAQILAPDAGKAFIYFQF